MKRVVQSRTGENGTCFRTCLASLLEIPEHEVPDFPDANQDAGVNQFLARHGLRYEEVPVSDTPPVGYYLSLGLSPRGGEHAVVSRDGKLAHDPHPQDGTGRGLVEEHRWGVLTPVAKDTHWEPSSTAEKFRQALKSSVLTKTPYAPGDLILLPNGKRAVIAKVTRGENLFHEPEWHIKTVGGEVLTRPIGKREAEDAVNFCECENENHGHRAAQCQTKTGLRRYSIGGYRQILCPRCSLAAAKYGRESSTPVTFAQDLRPVAMKDAQVECARCWKKFDDEAALTMHLKASSRCRQAYGAQVAQAGAKDSTTRRARLHRALDRVLVKDVLKPKWDGPTGRFIGPDERKCGLCKGYGSVQFGQGPKSVTRCPACEGAGIVKKAVAKDAEYLANNKAVFTENRQFTDLAEKVQRMWLAAYNTREGIEAVKEKMRREIKAAGTTPGQLAQYITKMATSARRRVNVNHIKNL